MRILLVDDNSRRVAKAVKSLVESGRVGHDDIANARCTAEAVLFMQDEKFDLLLIDLMIPGRLSDDPDVKHSLQLLGEINDGGSLRKPTKIIGLTEYDAAASEAADTFRQDAWYLLITSDLSDDWLDTIVRCIDYISEEQAQRESSSYLTDVLVVAAMKSELDAVYLLDWNWRAPEPADDNTFVVLGRIDVAGKSYSVVSAHAERMGMVSAAVLASKLISIYKPRICVMPGICAGVPGRAEIGDVVFADCSWDYQSGKHAVSEHGGSIFLSAPHQIAVDVRIPPRVDQLGADTGALHAVWKQWPNRPKNPFQVVRGPMGCGSAVLADSGVVERVEAQNRKLRAIEMESYGLLLAANYAASPRPLCIVAKSVCDFADSNKGDDHQAYACFTSARAIDLFLTRFMADLCG